MHEVSIMMSILDTALEEAKKANAVKITNINLLIGAKSGVVVDSLEFAFEMVTRDTIAEQAKLDIELVPFRGECLSCGEQFESEDFLICNKCGSFGKLISGQELNIQSIEVE